MSEPKETRIGIAATLARRPASFWSASLASLLIVIGGVGPWATEFGFVSLSGTSMHGWREVAVGAVGLAMLALYELLGVWPPLIVAAAAGALGALGALATVSRIRSGGAFTVLGQSYRYLDPAWGLYLVLVAAIVLLGSASALAWRASRAAG
jgi:hypothetical protein